MTHAYNKIYLDDACNLLGSYFDVAVNYFHVSLDTAYFNFLMSTFSQALEMGIPNIISGMSGVELYNRIFEDNKHIEYISLSKSKEYWLGYSLAYYHWYTSTGFAFVAKYIGIGELMDMYQIYHEMDIMHFIDHLNELINSRKGKSNLEIKRREAQLTREKLSFLSGVPIRTIEQYEQGLKDINKAQVMTVLALAKSLFCPPEEILEFTKQTEK